MIDAAEPLIVESDAQRDWPRRSLELTPLGRRVLAGGTSWIDHASHERWIGGVRIEPRKAHWAIDDALRPVWRAEPR